MFKHIVVLSLLLTGCLSDIPDEAVRPNIEEIFAVGDQVFKYNNHELLGPVSDRCYSIMSRPRIVRATREECLDLCQRDEPRRCTAGESLSPYGCKGGCSFLSTETRNYWLLTTTKTYPIIVSWQGWDFETHLGVVSHEATHMIAQCMRPGLWHYNHDESANRELWGPEGIWPL